MIENCNGWCKWLNENYAMPKGYQFTCGAIGNQVITEGQSKESLVRKWRSEVRSQIVVEQTCLAPDKKEIISPKGLPYGGIDPFAI